MNNETKFKSHNSSYTLQERLVIYRKTLSDLISCKKNAQYSGLCHALSEASGTHIFDVCIYTNRIFPEVYKYKPDVSLSALDFWWPYYAIDTRIQVMEWVIRDCEDAIAMEDLAVDFRLGGILLSCIIFGIVCAAFTLLFIILKTQLWIIPAVGMILLILKGIHTFYKIKLRD